MQIDNLSAVTFDVGDTPLYCGPRTRTRGAAPMRIDGATELGYDDRTTGPEGERSCCTW